MSSADASPKLAPSRPLGAVLATLVASWWVAGLFRGLFGILLNALPQHGLERLIGFELIRGWFAPSFVATALAAGLAALLLERRLGSGSGRSRLAVIAIQTAPLLLFWLSLGVHEIVTFTRFQETSKAGLRLSEAHVLILALAGISALIAALFASALSSRRAWRTVLAVALAIPAAVGWGSRILANQVPADAETRPNVVLITVDTLRADRLGSYGHGRSTTPHLDALAERGIRYSRSISQAPHTHPSMASMLTSAYPTSLGGDLKYIPYDLPTVAEVFQNAGYRTAAVSSNVWIKRALGFDQGFDHFDQTSAMSEFYNDLARIDWKNASHVSDAGIAWLDARPADGRPFFLWLHYLDPHHPYDPQAPFAERFATPERTPPPAVAELNTLPTGEQTERLMALTEEDPETSRASFDAILDLYDGEIAFTDEQIGRVLDHLAALGLDGSTAIAFTADHGEEFLDHDSWGHSHTLYNELIHVPLILAYPDQPRRGIVRDNVVRTLDIAPTLIDIAGLPIPKTMRGRSLLQLERRRPPADPPALSVLTSKRQLSVELKGWKLIYSPRDGKAQLYDLNNDPGETTDLADAEPERVQGLILALEDTLGKLPRWAHTEVREHMLDPATREQLRALGYVQ